MRFLRGRELRQGVKIGLLKQNLAIEPDVQNFIGFVHAAVTDLGGNAFAAALGLIELSQKLRAAGAGTGYPLPVVLELSGAELQVGWNGAGPHAIAHLDAPPASEAVTALCGRLRHSTEGEDPAVLLRRNAEMERFLEESRARAEQALADMQTALAKRQAELQDSMRQAETDALTGLYNRRAYDARVAEAFRTAKDQGGALTLVLCDLDYFKQINDEHGHQYGDTYLCRMAQAMLSVTRRQGDAAFRFGGDEFAILYMCGKDIALKRAFRLLGLMNGRISVGIAGVSPQEPCGGDLGRFIGRADKALYEAKGRGRGRVVVDTCYADGTITYDEHPFAGVRVDP